MPDEFTDITVRTEIHCHNCHKPFVAELDGGIDGDHEIECPCGHIHYRKVTAGRVTGDRFSSDDSGNKKKVKARSTWRSLAIKAKTNTVAEHIRERWMNRSDYVP